MLRARNAAKAMGEADDTDYFVAALGALERAIFFDSKYEEYRAGGNVSPDKRPHSSPASGLQLFVPLAQ